MDLRNLGGRQWTLPLGPPAVCAVPVLSGIPGETQKLKIQRLIEVASLVGLKPTLSGVPPPRFSKDLQLTNLNRRHREQRHC